MFLLVTMSKELFAGLVLFPWFSSWKVRKSGIPTFISTENPIFRSLYHFFVVLRMLRSSRSYLFYKRSAFKILQNLQKTICAGVFLNKVRLANIIKKSPTRAFSCQFFEITKETFFIKYFRATSRLENSP